MLDTCFFFSLTTEEICPICWETFGQYGGHDELKSFLHHITNNHELMEEKSFAGTILVDWRN
jgi:hypothetical protein